MTDRANNPIYQGVSRNSTCPCGSGKRFKHCHGRVPQQNRESIPSVEKTAPKKLSGTDHLFCVVEGKFYDLDESKQYLFVADHSNSRIQLDKHSCLILQEMDDFASFNEHFEVCSKKFGIEKSQFQISIDQLHEQGLFLTAKSVLESLKKHVKNISSEFAGVCIRTCETPSYLKRILGSQIRRKEKFGVNESFFVFDDSDGEKSISENKRIVNDASAKIDVSYLGLEWQLTFAGRLIDAFPKDKKVIESLLLPREGVSFSGGRIMNLALLFFAGKRYLNFDDDFILDDVRTHQSNSNNLVQLGKRPDRIYDGYDSEEQVMQAGIPLLNLDPLSWHKKSLGMVLYEYFNEQNESLFNEKSLAGLSSYTLQRYKPNSFIITTGNGWFGTPGKRDGRFIFLARYKSIKPPWVVASNFEQLSNGGYCWDSITQTEITERGLSTPAGINNTQLLAPTVASCKGEDNLLCSMASIIHPNSVHLGFSWALAHFRKPKNWEEDTYHMPKPLLLPDLIKAIAQNVLMPGSVSCADRLKAISVALLDVSSLSEKLFREKLQFDYLDTSIWQIKRLNIQLESITSENEGCRSKIERLIKKDLEYNCNNRLPPIEDAIGETEQDQIKWAQQELGIYAQGLSIWPKLWNYCASLNRE